MKLGKRFAKLIALIVIAGLIFQVDTLIYGQQNDEITRQLIKAQHAYLNGQYISAKNRIERIIGIISDQGAGRDKTLGKCYLLLGAIYEKENKPLIAEENYRKALDQYNIKTIDKLDLNDLPLYNKIFHEKLKEELETNGNTIAKEGKKKKRRKFPWLIVAGAVVVLTIVAVLVFKKKKKNQVLTVIIDEGVDGTPAAGTYTHKVGSTVNYNFTTKPGYSDLTVLFDGIEVAPSGTLTIRGPHTLRASASANTPKIVTNLDSYWMTIDEGKTATFGFKLSAQPRENFTVTVERISGDAEINVISGQTVTFTSSNWDNFHIVTLQAEEDSNIKNNEATFRMNPSSSNLPPDNIVVREIDNDVLSFVTDVDELSVREGRTTTFNVRLSTSPGATVTARVEKISNDNSLRVQSSPQLIFTPEDWFISQTVTLQAVEDVDTVNSQAEIQISAPGVSSKTVAVEVIDNDGLGFVTNTNDVSVVEGGTGEFQVKLTARPPGNVNATVEFVKGDTDISIKSGANLSFTTTNWDTYQLVTLKAEEDTNFENDKAIFQISAPNVSSKELTATEIDNDIFSFVVDPESLPINEGENADVKVKLSAEPPADVTASISYLSGDTDISIVSDSTLTFNVSNWDTWQIVTFHAAEDDDAIGMETIFQISSNDLPSKNITLHEVDNESIGIVTDEDTVYVNEGMTGDFQVRLSTMPPSDVTLSVVNWSGDSDIVVQAGDSLTFTASNWDTYQTVTLAAAQDNDAGAGQTIIRISGSELTEKDITAIEVEDDVLEFDTDSVSQLEVVETGTADLHVRLTAEPQADVDVYVEYVSGDTDISILSGSSLTFTSSDWNTYQVVTFTTVRDLYAVDDSAVFRLRASGLPDKDITVTEDDNSSIEFITDDTELSIDEGSTASFQVKLSEPPDQDVEVEVIHFGGDKNISVQSGSPMIFTVDNWNEYQTVVLQAAEDDEDIENEQATMRVGSPGIPGKEVIVTKIDND